MAHFAALQAQTGCAYEDMLFFDDAKVLLSCRAAGCCGVRPKSLTLSDASMPHHYHNHHHRHQHQHEKGGRYGNCEPVAALGVMSAHCPRGLTSDVWQNALREFCKAKATGGTVGRVVGRAVPTFELAASPSG